MSTRTMPLNFRESIGSLRLQRYERDRLSTRARLYSARVPDDEEDPTHAP
jgi:hypothetical protein